MTQIFDPPHISLVSRVILFSRGKPFPIDCVVPFTEYCICGSKPFYSLASLSIPIFIKKLYVMSDGCKLIAEDVIAMVPIITGQKVGMGKARHTSDSLVQEICG